MLEQARLRTAEFQSRLRDAGIGLAILTAFRIGSGMTGGEE